MRYRELTPQLKNEPQKTKKVCTSAVACVESVEKIRDLLRVIPGRITRCWKPRGSSRVGPGGVGNVTIWIVSGQEAFKSHGLGHDLTRQKRNAVKKTETACFTFYSFIHIFICLFIYSVIFLFIYSLCLFTYSFIYVFMYLCIYLFRYLFMYLFIYLFILGS